MSPLKVFITFSFLCGSAFSSCDDKEQRKVFRALGWKRLNAFYCTQDKHRLFHLVKVLGSVGIAVSLARDWPSDKNAGSLVLCDDSSIGFERIQNLSGRELHAYRSLFVTRRDRLPIGAADANRSIGFFQLEMDTCRFYRVQTFREAGQGPIRNLWHFRSDNSAFFNETFNLGGSVLTFQTLEWRPWLYFTECKETDDENEADICQVQGILPAIVEAIAERFNFTSEYRKEPSGDWGGSDAVAMNFDGAYGGVAKGLHDGPISVWAHELSRDPYVDATISVWDRPVALIGDFGQADLDTTLFIRPFTYESWAVIAACLVFGVICLKMVQILSPCEDHASVRIVVLALWTAFVLLNAYYSGALTMFFSSKPRLPFSRIEDAVRLFPAWKIIMHCASDLYFPSTPEMLAYKERMLEDGHYLPSFEDLLKEIKATSDRVMFDSPDAVSAYYFQMAPSERPESLVYLEPSDAKTSAFIFEKGSPLTKMFNVGIQTLKQTGFVDFELKQGLKLIPRGVDSAGGTDDKKVLGLKHVNLALFSYGAVLIAVAVICIGEILFAPKKKKAKQKKVFFREKHEG